MLKKLKSKRAETLLETLVSVLIAVLSVSLLTSAVVAAARINRTTREAEDAYKSELEEAETASRVYPGSHSVTITFDAALGISPETVTVTVYGIGQYASYEEGGGS